MTIAQLKSFARVRRLQTANMNKVAIISALLAAPPLKKNIKQTLMNTWFMKPRKASIAMKTGSINERNIVRALPKFFDESDSQWRILSSTSTGLLSRTDRPDLADSPDNLLHLERASMPGMERADANGFRAIAVLEAKTVAELSTERKAQTRVQNIPLESRAISVLFDSDMFRKLIWTPEYRGQVHERAY